MRVTTYKPGGRTQYALGFEKQARPGDLVMAFGDLRVVVSLEDAGKLRSTVIDYVDSPVGAGFKFVST